MLSGRRPGQVDQHHHKMMPKQCRLYKGKLQQVHQGLPWGRCQVPQHWRPAKKGVNKSSLRSPRHTRTSLPTWIRWCHPTRSEWLPSLSSVKQPTRRLAFLIILPRTRSSRGKRKRLMFLLCIAMNQATISIAVITTATIIKATNAIATITNLTIIIEMIDATIALDVKTRNWKAPSPMTKDDRKCNYSKKKSNKAMRNDQSSKSSAGNMSGKRSWSCSRSSLRSQSWSCSHSSSWSYDNHHVEQDDCKPSAAPKRRYSYSSESDNGECIHCPDKSNTVFATFSTPKAKKKCTQK